MSQDELAKASGVPKGTIGTIEAGYLKSPPGLQVLDKLARGLRVDPSVLIDLVRNEGDTPASLNKFHEKLHENLTDIPISENSDPEHAVKSKTQSEQSLKASEINTYEPITIRDSICNEDQKTGLINEKVISLSQIHPIREVKLLPVYGVEICGKKSMLEQKSLYFIEVMDILADCSDCAVVSDGKSLYGYREGDFVALKLLPDEAPFDDEDVVIWTEGKGAGHRIYHHDDRGGYLEAIPGSGDPWRTDATSPGVRIVGAVTGLVFGRRSKRIEHP